MKQRSSVTRIAMALLLGTLALTPAACGKKGSPVLPEGQTDNFPQQYPKDTEPQQGVFN